MGESVYHVELRQFPHNTCRFNVAGEELRAKLLLPWAQERWVEFGERKWSPHQATLTVLEGPRIPFGQLTMGRGWRTAQRSARDVTEEVLAGVKEELEEGTGAGARSPVAVGPTGPADTAHGEDPTAASLALELLAQLGGGPLPLRRVWELAAERDPGSVPSAALALAERAIESLLGSGLIVLALTSSGSERAGVRDEIADAEDAVRLLRVPANWVSDAVSVRRA